MMKHYKINNKIRAIEEGQEFLVQSDWVELSDEELQIMLNPPKTAEQLQVEVNEEARAYLVSTDWYITRLAETGVAVPQEVLDKRAEARASIV